jgi:hypothetical protein
MMLALYESLNKNRPYLSACLSAHHSGADCRLRWDLFFAALAIAQQQNPGG